MATLYISEFVDAGRFAGNNVSVAKEPCLVEQTVAIGGTSTQSSAFNSNTQLVRLHTDAICSVKFGTNPTATATTKRLAANQTEYFAVAPGLKVAVITNT